MSTSNSDGSAPSSPGGGRPVAAHCGIDATGTVEDSSDNFDKRRVQRAVTDHTALRGRKQAENEEAVFYAAGEEEMEAEVKAKPGKRGPAGARAHAGGGAGGGGGGVASQVGSSSEGAIKGAGGRSQERDRCVCLGPAASFRRAASEGLRAVEALTRKPSRAKGDYGMPGWVRAKEGGLKCVNMELLASQKGVIGFIVKSAGSALLQGKSVVNISLPVRVFEPRSFLERIPDAWCYTPLYLARAADAGARGDHLERFKWVVTSMVSGLYRAAINLKPFNPILGETYEAEYEDGTSILLEQVSHHPPVSAFQVLGAGGAYVFDGEHEFQATLRPNSVVGKQVGPNRVRFPDGTVIEFNLPTVQLKGTMWGDRHFSWQGTSTFVDRKNNMRLDLKFNPGAKSGLTSIFSSQKVPVDHVRGAIVQANGKAPGGKGKGGKDKKALCLVTGSWMEGVEFDGRRYHANKSVDPFVPRPVRDPLPSDCRYREDLIALKSGDHDEAQKMKAELENRQRADKKRRKKMQKK